MARVVRATGKVIYLKNECGELGRVEGPARHSEGLWALF